MKQAVLLIIIFILVGCGMKTGEEALSQMNTGQKQTVEFILGLTMSTTISEISAELGEPSDMGVGGLNPTWELKHEGDITHIRAYFLTNQLNKIQYMSLSPMWGYTAYYDESGVRPGT